jgi:putative transposase
MTNTLNINRLLFFTATILNWYHLLENDKYKELIINSLKYLVGIEKIKLSAFVIMPNHIHLAWKINNKLKLADVQRDFLKFTAQMIKNDLIKTNKNLLKKFHVGLKDREYQIWQRKPLKIDLITEKVTKQKIDYIHYNPVNEKWKLCNEPQEYKYSSAKFYCEGIDEWNFLTHYNEVYN